MKEKQSIILGYYRDGKSGRRLSRELGLSRKTVWKYIREYGDRKADLEARTGEPIDELVDDLISPPSYDSSSRVRRKVTDAMIERVEALLSENEQKRLRGQHKQQLKKIDIHEVLVSEGFDIGYGTVCNLVRELEDHHRESYIKQAYDYGDICEFDWGEVTLFIDGRLRKIQLAVFTSAAGNYRFCYLFYKQDTASFQQAHVFFFDHVGGVYRKLVYDNMRTAVKRFVGYSEKEATAGLLQLSLYYQFYFRFCNIARGNEKGHVERSVEYIRRKAFSRQDCFDTLEDANKHLLSVCERLNQRPQKEHSGQSAADILKIERDYLLPAPPPFECGQLRELGVDKYSTITVDTCHYSVPDRYVGKKLRVKVYPHKIVCYADHHRICEHEKRHGAHEWSLHLDHYLTTLQRKPGALAGSVALSQAPPSLKRIYEQYYPDDPKGFIDLLHYQRDHHKTLSEIEQAIDRLSRLSSGEITTDKIKVICDRRPAAAMVRDGKIEHRALVQLQQLAGLLPKMERPEVIV